MYKIVIIIMISAISITGCGDNKAKKDMLKVKVLGSSIPHDVCEKYAGAKVLLKPASEGTGIIACGPVRAVCEACGIKDILTKSLGNSNHINVARATIVALTSLKNIKEELAKRKVTVKAGEAPASE